ncbi:MAG: tRNA (adenosine(37)-N6)-threonylcarbamoyltransferase complex dimerization subunit type 1 TsaB [Planctomycetota bacterium]|jgi:tRNA threonylcarbamoyladenosine biosynthesis protein TsaB
MERAPLILAVETSGRIGSVALALGEKILGQKTFSGSMRHSAEVFPSIRVLLEAAGREPKEIAHVYISVGPGSFTGLRIAVALAKTMHLANGAKIVAVGTLDAIASNTNDYIKETKANINRIATILDAKRGQFFIAAYKLHSRKSDNTQYATHNMQYEKILPDCLMKLSQFRERFAGKAEPIWLLGEGLLYYKDEFKAENIHFLPQDYWSPKASKVHQLGWQIALKERFADPLTLEPTYIRRPEAEEKRGPHKTTTKQ